MLTSLRCQTSAAAPRARGRRRPPRKPRRSGTLLLTSRVRGASGRCGGIAAAAQPRRDFSSLCTSSNRVFISKRM
eukprot:1977059-Pyramimonas_sp.AAC.1